MHYHLIGIGGSSMSGIARLLREEGQHVTGTDEQTTGHGPHLLPATVDVVVYNEAITPGSSGWPELEAARTRGLTTQRRIEFIAERMGHHYGMAIAGAHGKSTTSALIAWILFEAGEDPTMFIGADLPAFGGSARSGQGRFVVVEACEWNKQFLLLRPNALVITTIDREHLDTYPGGEGEIVAAFHAAATNVPSDGFIVANHDDYLVRRALAGVDRPTHWFGRSTEATYRIVTVETQRSGALRVKLEIDGHVEELISPLVGEHHALNLAAAFAAVTELGIDRATIVRSVQTFPGLTRRFERYRDDKIVTIVDDYAHHPTEIGATLRAARQHYPNRRIVAVFQPHLSERTTDLFGEFVAAFQLADQVVIAPTYEPPGRVQIPNAKTSAELVAALKTAGTSAMAITSSEAAATTVGRLLKVGDVVLTIGATSIWQVAAALRLWSPNGHSAQELQ